MVRFAILILTIPFVFAQNGNYLECVELLNTVSECFESNGNSTTFAANNDPTACVTCFTNEKFFENFDGTASCDEAKSEICDFLVPCRDDCYPTVNVCQEEYNNYVECTYSAVFAPDGCTVQCDGTSSGGGSNTNGGSNTSGNTTGNSGNGNSNTSGSTSGSTMSARSSWMATSMLIAVATIGGSWVGNIYG